MRYFLSLCVILCLGCQHKNVNPNPHFGHRELLKVRLVPKDTIIYQLNDQTIPSENMQYFDEGGSPELVFMNGKKTALEFYDARTRQFRSELILDTAVKKASGFYIRDTDSIFIYSEAKKTFWLTGPNRALRAFNIHSAVERAGVIAASPMITVSAPAGLYHNDLIYSGFKVGEPDPELHLKRYYGGKLDLSNGKVKDFLNYPSLYERFSWGGQLFMQPFVTFNAPKGLLIASLPNSHDLLVTDLATGRTSAHPAGSVHVEAIEPLSGAVKGKSHSAKDLDTSQYFSLSDNYRNIIYDKYRDLYYRIVQYKCDEDDLDASGLALKSSGVIILDKDLKFMGETKLPKGASIWRYFVSERGLSLLDYQNKNENIAKFVEYEVVKN